MPRVRPVVVAVGDAIVDVATPPVRSLPRGDAQLIVPRVSLLAGGNATNFALQAAALRARVRFVGCVGADPFGEFLRKTYASRGVQAILRVDDARPTGTTTAIAREDGSRILITAPGANGSLREADVPRTAFAGADHVHRAGFWWTTLLQGLPTARILARARRAGATTSLDIATDPRGWPEDRVDRVRSSLSRVTTFFCNEAEAKAIAGVADPIRAAKAVCRLGAEEVVLHRGSRGAVWVRGSEVVASRAFPSRPDNPTGCGDVFNAAFVVARLRGDAVRDALRFSNGCAALHLRDRARPYPVEAAVRRLVGPVPARKRA
jgi:sugar/nucleoside kinase (ribokinase family)